jgi:PncC family amidohydrolase
MDTLAALTVGELLKRHRHTIGVAESSAGGLINASLVAVPGASAYYLGGGIVYTAKSRASIFGITQEDMAGMRSASEPFAQLLARRIRDKLGATWGLAETGAAGPTGNRYGDAAGHACIAVCGPVEKVLTIETGQDGREANMWVFARAALDLLAACLAEADGETHD